MGNRHKNIQLMLEFLKGPFLVLHFANYTLMTLMMLSVIWSGTLTLSLLLRLPSKKLKFFSPEVALYLCKSTI